MKLISLTTYLALLTSFGYAQISDTPFIRTKETITIDPGGHPLISEIYVDRDAGDIIVADDFSDFSDWLSIAEDGTAANWDWVTETPSDIATHMGEMASTTNENGFAIFNGLQYLLDTDVAIQNASLEYQPLINCADVEAVILSFEQRYRGFNYDKTYVEVSNNGGATYDYSYELNPRSFVNETPIQENVTINITEAAAGFSEVMIRFRWETSDDDELYGSGYAWMIDDFSVYEGWNADLKITDAFIRSGVDGLFEKGMTYYQLPIAQVTEINLSANVENLSSLIQENVKLNVSISGAEEHLFTSDVTDLEVGVKDSLFCTEIFLPETVGNYELNFWFDSDNDEDVVSNDTITIFMRVAYDWEFNDYAMHNGEETGSISNVLSNTGAPILIGNLMYFNVDSEFREVQVTIPNDSSQIGQLIYVQIMSYNEDTDAFVYMEQTDDHEITFGNLGTAVSLYFEHSQCYNENEYGLILAGHYAGDNPVHFSLAQDVDEKIVIGYTSGATDPFYLVNPQALMIHIPELESGACGAFLDENQQLFNISQNTPNPFSKSTTIPYELIKNTDVHITITDLSGKIIETINLGNQAGGKHEIHLNANNYSEGVYFYTFNVGNEQITKRMIVF